MVVTGRRSCFYQAEDGIRDLVRSRGLGDVYKRQEQGAAPRIEDAHEVPEAGVRRVARLPVVVPVVDPVSYTHLTLPTSDLV